MKITALILFLMSVNPIVSFAEDLKPYFMQEGTEIFIVEGADRCEMKFYSFRREIQGEIKVLQTNLEVNCIVAENGEFVRIYREQANSDSSMLAMEWAHEDFLEAFKAAEMKVCSDIRTVINTPKGPAEVPMGHTFCKL
jgi:hypothetical protein